MGEGGVKQEMVGYGCPKLCWDYCLVMESYARSHTTLGIFSLEGQVHESRVEVEPADISPMAENAWYEWVKFRDTSDSKIQLDREMGATLDIGL
jgi:hypothetical protein